MVMCYSLGGKPHIDMALDWFFLLLCDCTLLYCDVIQWFNVLYTVDIGGSAAQWFWVLCGRSGSVCPRSGSV